MTAKLMAELHRFEPPRPEHRGRAEFSPAHRPPRSHPSVVVQPGSPSVIVSPRSLQAVHAPETQRSSEVRSREAQAPRAKARWAAVVVLVVASVVVLSTIRLILH